MKLNIKRVLLLGADGFIGRHIAYHLRQRGISLICVARDTRALQQMGFEVFQADLLMLHDNWAAVLKRCDVIVNAAGLLNGAESDMHRVHVSAPAAIYRLGKDAGVSRIILISAVGIEADTAFGRTKTAGERVLQQSGLPHVILRPSMVLAETSYGGSSMLRALAAFPVLTPMVGDGQQQFDPIHADDLAEVVRMAITSDRLDGQIICPCGPERVTQAKMLEGLRGWLGRPKLRQIGVPLRLARWAGWLGDRLKLGPISTTAVAQLEQGVGADYAAFHAQTGLTPRGFSQMLAARPAGSQDLWHARLYLLRPLVRFGLLFMWLISGLVGLFLPAERFVDGLSGLGLPDMAITVAARGAGLVDLAIALGLLLAWKLRKLALAQLAMVGAYTVVFGLLVPGLWLEPYGGLLKNIPVLLLILIHRVLEEEH